jgi:hypothetical protein
VTGEDDIADTTTGDTIGPKINAASGDTAPIRKRDMKDKKSEDGTEKSLIKGIQNRGSKNMM